MTAIAPIYVGNEAIAELLAYCQEHGLKDLVLVADRNTYAALGERVEQALRGQGYTPATILLEGKEVVADEATCMSVLVRAPARPQTYIAVGSGTITDIARFASHRSRNPFLSLPTAPSVDGYTSNGAPLVLGGVKITVDAQPPQAIFADLPTLRAAPAPLIAAGFGDLLGKTTSVADWRLGALLWGEAYDEAIAARTENAYRACLRHVDAIQRRDEAGIRALIEGLIESGLCILDFGRSHPASGSEHHASHYWEMTLLQQGRPAILHGAKVGVATGHIAGLYARLRGMAREEAFARIERAGLPAYEAEVAAIRGAYGPLAETIIRGHGDFLQMSAAAFADLKQRAIRHWDAVLEIAERVPPPEEITRQLGAVGGPVNGRQLGLAEDEVQRGLQYGHYLRSRFTITKMFHVFDLA